MTGRGTNPDFVTKTDLAAQALRQAILAGDLKPGDRIVAETFGEAIGLSATPIREATRLLEAAGLVDIIPHRGAYVSRVSRSDFVQVYRMRGSLESLAVAILVEDTPVPERERILDVVEKHQDRFRSEVTSGNEMEARAANREFHFELYANVGGRLHAMISNLWAVFPFDTLWLIPSRPMIAVDEHDAIITAIRDGDAERAASEMRTHIEGAARLFVMSPKFAEYFDDCA